MKQERVAEGISAAQTVAADPGDGEVDFNAHEAVSPGRGQL